MAFTDSMFLFEMVVEELISYNNCKEFGIKSQFADIFCINLNDPNEPGSFLAKRTKKFKRRSRLLRNSKAFSDRSPATSNIQTGQSVLFESNVDTLISTMKQYPMELSLWSKVIPDYKIGSTHIPWNASYTDYLSKLHRRQPPPPVCVRGDYNVFDEFTSKRMAVIKLNIKLSHLKDNITTEFRSLSEENQQTFMYTGFNSNPQGVLCTIKDKPINLAEGTGVIKTFYSGGRRKVNNDKNKKASKKNKKITAESGKIKRNLNIDTVKEDKIQSRKINKNIVSLIKSDTNMNKSKELEIIKCKSCSSINNFNILNYIFSGSEGPFGNQVYCVGYFTVEKDFADSPKSAKSAGSEKEAEASDKSERSDKSEKSDKSVISDRSQKSLNSDKSEKSVKTDEPKVKEKYKFKICSSECPGKKGKTASCVHSVCSLDLPQEAAHLITMRKCDRVDCNYKIMRELPTPPDDRILLDLSNLKKECCDVTEKVEEVVGGMKAKMKFGDDPCFCECECRFGFTKKTTYCNICGGYEVCGDEHARKPGYDMPFPCPIFHKLAEKGKLKTLSTSGSESKKKDSLKQKSTADKSAESDKDLTKQDKKKKDNRFKFNYGYTGIPPQIGHSHCVMPCTGTLGPVPRNMGWLWTAEDVPGLKFRPTWKPGAANKHVVRLLKIAKNPGEMLAKKRKKDQGKVKRPLKRPLLIVHKKEGEYTVTMETMKQFTKQRTFNQYPYEDKPLVTYTIGMTEEEKRLRHMKKDRKKRQLEAAQRQFIQSAFKDMCQEICLKTYQQALGILPDAEKPDCPCYPTEPDPERNDLDYCCNCSEDKSLRKSDSDSDEWFFEFTPPNATFDPSYKSKKVTSTDNATQYTYMDYRVKLLDRYGNPVPRFFKGPDGKQQCSDLGGFWSPDHKWLEINVDGFIGPDEKWAPHSFIGPNGEAVDAEPGKFQAANGKWLVVGVDGYVDSQGKWKFYCKPKAASETKKRRPGGTGKKAAGENQEEKASLKQSEATWSCFGSVSPKQLSKMGIIGHGQDKKLLLSTLQEMLAQGEDVIIPEPSIVPRSGRKGNRRTSGPTGYEFTIDRRKCKHATPSDKGIIAVDGHGHKTYFRFKDNKNRRPKERIATLTDQGISVSSFHLPCFHSFISTEMMKKQQYERLLALSKGANANNKSTTASTQADYVYVV